MRDLPLAADAIPPQKNYFCRDRRKLQKSQSCSHQLTLSGCVKGMRSCKITTWTEIGLGIRSGCGDATRGTERCVCRSADAVARILRWALMQKSSARPAVRGEKVARNWADGLEKAAVRAHERRRARGEQNRAAPRTQDNLDSSHE